MIKKVTEIFNAWKISMNPSEEQEQIAQERLQVCESCEFKKDEPILHCSACGCPLGKKVFSQVPKSCPKGKWSK